MSMGNLESSSGEPLSGTMVATIDSTSSIAGTASAIASSFPSNGARNTRGRGSCRRRRQNAGNIGM